jgi:hypothetical protein
VGKVVFNNNNQKHPTTRSTRGRGRVGGDEVKEGERVGGGRGAARHSWRVRDNTLGVLTRPPRESYVRAAAYVPKT